MANSYLPNYAQNVYAGGKYYNLDPGGYYTVGKIPKKYTGKKYGSLSSYLTEAASNFLNPIYKGYEGSINTSSANALKEAKGQLLDEFGNRNLLNSSVYGDAYGKAVTQNSNDKALQLADLALSRMQAVQGLVNNQLTQQQQGPLNQYNTKRSTMQDVINLFTGTNLDLIPDNVLTQILQSYGFTVTRNKK